MKIGIIGLPNVGKSTLFKALTKNKVDINNYPFCTIEPNIGIVEVPDERLDKLSKMSGSEKTVPAIIEFVDIAGLVKGASKGEGLGNKFLANIREVDAIIHVVRVFKDNNITHVHNEIDPLRDVDIINMELVLADLETVNKRIEKLKKDVKRNNKEAKVKLDTVKKIKSMLEDGWLGNEMKLNMEDDLVRVAVQELSLLTRKPFLYAYNVSDLDEILDSKLENKKHIKLDIKIEEELREMTSAEIKELGLKTGLNELIKKSYELLNLITFLTTGKKESRAWTIKKDITAPIAGSVIHNDFQNKFVCAEVIRWDELLDIGSTAKAREMGKIKTVGKDYVIQDGDVIEFKIGG